MEETTHHREESAGPAWTFRGYQLEAANFTTAMAHFYRAEVGRANTWRNRLDTTTNWAVVTVGAALTFVFGAPDNPHFVLLLVLLLVLAFLSIESRRYRYYQLWSYRVHLMETDFFAAMLAPPFRPSSDWADHLVQTLLNPRYTTPLWEAAGLRFRRNYLVMISLILFSWIVKLYVHPTSAADWATMVGRAAIGPIPGAWALIGAGLIYVALIGLMIATLLPVAWKEKLLRPRVWERGPFRQKPAPQEELATIITSCGKEIGSRLIAELERGVTALHGTGLYSGKPRDVLLCAITGVQVPQLKAIVREIDPNAFFIVSQAEEVRGWGFQPFEPPS
jgi:uncharacterized membrane protein